MIKYLITVSYDGSKYMGLQKLKDETTVQGELETVLTRLEGKHVKVYSAGRTDRGVHALDQKCMFYLSKDIDPYRLRYYIDRSTSKYLFVKDCTYIDDEVFHPRFSVVSKTYKYIINTGLYDPINCDYVYNYNKKLDVNLMELATENLIGPHNYRAFVIGEHKTCDSIIDDINIEKKEEQIIIKIRGKAFYTYMVRNIVKVLVLIGEHKITIKDIEYMLATGKKIFEYSPAPPGGLYLEKVEY